MGGEGSEDGIIDSGVREGSEKHVGQGPASLCLQRSHDNVVVPLLTRLSRRRRQPDHQALRSGTNQFGFIFETQGPNLCFNLSDIG